MTIGERLLRLVQLADEDDDLDLEFGGDGDNGEMLAGFIDELVERGVIVINFPRAGGK